MKKAKPAKATPKKAAEPEKKKAAPKKKAPEPVEENETAPKKKKAEPVEEKEADSDAEEDEDDALILAAEIDGEDDTVAEDASLFKEGQDVGKIPEVSKKVKESSKGKTGETGVIYIGRVPHGFYEFEMRQYFSQFGEISRLRLSRNRKTGASKHFAFVEFAEESTANVVAKTMDNYLLFGHILKCKVVPKAQVHENLFKGANQRFKKVPWNRIAGKKLEKPKSEAAWESKVQREKNKRTKNAEKLKALGYDFEMPDIKSVPAPGTNGVTEDEPKAIEEAPVAEKKETPAKKASKVAASPAKSPAKSPATKKAKKAKA